MSEVSAVVLFMLNDMRRAVVCLLDIGEIVDHHCLISIFRMDTNDLFEKVKPFVEHNLTVQQKAKLYDDWGATYEEV